MHTKLIRRIAIVLTFLLFNAPNLIHAQGIDIGGKLGPQFAGAEGLDEPNTDVTFGGFVTLQPGQQFALQAEVLYSPRPGFGASLSFMAEDEITGEPVVVDRTMKLAPTYLELPVLAEFLLPFSETSRFGFHANGGASVAFLLSCSPWTVQERVVSLVTGELVSEDQYEVDMDENCEAWKSPDVSLVFGGGIDLAIGQAGRLILDARYLMGLSTYAKGTSDIKNRTFTVTVGFGYRIKR